MLTRRETPEVHARDDRRRGGTEMRPPHRRRWVRYMVFGFLLLLILGGVIGRVLLPGLVRDYVNRTLERNELYSGRIGAVHIHLWRGAYSIHDIRISKRTGNVPVPLLRAKSLDLSVQWNALIHRRLVTRIVVNEPEVNFVDAGTKEESQTGGAGGPWLQMVQDLTPFKVNSAIVQHGSIHFRSYKGPAPIDVYVSELNASLENLSNIRDDTNPLLATVRASGLLMDHAKLDLKIDLDPFSYRPTFHMAMRLLGLDVTRINDLARAYGKFDFERGWFDLVLECDSKEGQLGGYVKPLFRNLKVFSLTKDIQQGNPLEFFWQALVGGATAALRNFPRDQFGTKIPFTGDFSKKTTIDIFATVGNVLRNAFIRAYLPRLENQQAAPQPGDGLNFDSPEFDDTLSVGGVL